MLDPSLKAALDRAFEIAKKAGLAGVDIDNPYHGFPAISMLDRIVAMQLEIRWNDGYKHGLAQARLNGIYAEVDRICGVGSMT